eukprot:TRINITY_DN4809_c0_g1_i2.p1 TRINITY_DN4809_c0_g1~~TRINITY_DN4809_c0_g1_i2.p1  ORF type:complete len:559 (+),score=142.64 TRINITY_DN4809_c0_g1_i2:79-1755(+)
MEPALKKTKKEKKQKKLQKEQSEQIQEAPVEQETEDAPVKETFSADGAKKKKDKRNKLAKENDDGEEIATEAPNAPFSSATPSSRGGRSNKNFYSQSKKTRSRAASEIEEFYRSKNIKIDCTRLSSAGDTSLFHPILTFEELQIDAKLASCLSGFQKPTPIQSQCWPVALSGNDTIGVAETGSGKTIAFGIPAFMHLLHHKPLNAKPNHQKAIRVLVLSPTRELAIQIYEVFEKAGRPLNLNTVCIYGGASKEQQKAELSQKPAAVIATPGRLIDLIKEGSINLSDVTYFVLDEADRMLDLGFEKEVEYIASLTNKDRQTIMFSATWPVAVRQLADKFLHEPIRVTVGEDDLTANHRVKQIVEVIDEYEKQNRLIQLLQEYHNEKNRILIFALYKAEASRLLNFLQKRGYKKACGIHGDMTQAQRIESINNFKAGKNLILVATDVAARGLDIPDIEYVINVTFPLTIEDYIHRIGRTGRAGKMGISHTLLTPQDRPKASELAQILEQANQPIPPDLAKMATGPIVKKRKQHELYGAHFKPDNGGPMPQATRITFGDDD